MNTSGRHLVLVCVLAGSFVSAARGAEIALVPVSATGAHTIAGDLITLDGGGQWVVMDLMISGWDPDGDGFPKLIAFQGVIDSSGYSSGAAGTLVPAIAACGGEPDPDAFCRSTHGGICSFTGGSCVQDAECPFSPAEFCKGSECGYPTGVGGECEPGFIYAGRSDYIFLTVQDLPAVDLSLLDFRYASAAQTTPVSDPGIAQYAGTLVLDVPVGASGTFTIGFVPSPDTILQDDNNQLITPLVTTAARIRIPCQVDADCNDNSLCTDDSCRGATGTCQFTPNYNVANDCCDPATRTLTTIDDGNVCTVDVCNPDDGTVSHDPVTVGTACGSPGSTECDDPDSCDALGVCQANPKPVTTPCGDPTDTECTDPDSCDGAGACLPNHTVAGAACGDPTNTDCDNPDTCSGSGSCLINQEPDGTECDDGLFCNVGETCTAGACGGGGPRDCGDSIPCTTDSCNDTTDLCENDLNPGFCLIAGACIGDGQPNPANPCEACLTALSTSAWSSRPLGTACGDATETECNHADTCNGAGVCLTNLEPLGFACGDVSNTDCTDPDTCDGAGVCEDNHAAVLTPCGDPADTDCDNPDTCDGGGVCLDNLEPDGTGCDDGLFCNVGETCTAGACGGGGPRNCSDGLACTTDSCDEAGNVCVSDLDPGFCLIAGSCRSDGQTNPANDCEECNPLLLTTNWSARALGTLCGDGSDTDCTNPDTCDGAGTCSANDEVLGTPCGDPTNTDCTDPDTCDGGGVCLDNHATNGTGCDDGLFCLVNEFCTDGACGSGVGRDCGDGIGCTNDACDEVNDVCNNNANDVKCDNGEWCDGVEICDSLADCVTQPGSVPVPDDGVPCTNDFCDEVNDVIVNDPIHANCNNGQFCDGVEICDSVQNCIVQPGSTPNPDDGVGCTDDSCDEVNDVIVNTPNDVHCPDDGLFCNGDEFCHAVNDCDHTGSPCGGPCDEVNDKCLCEAPIVEAVGSRYLRISIQPPGSGPQAIVITPDCAGGVPQYVCGPPTAFDIDVDGLDDENVAELADLCDTAASFLTPAEWGELYVYGEGISAGSSLIVQGDCGSPGTPGFSDSTVVTTPIFGDTVGLWDGTQWTAPDGVVAIIDIVGIMDRFRADSNAPSIDRVDLLGTGPQGTDCTPEQIINIIDIVGGLEGFLGTPYGDLCPLACP